MNIVTALKGKRTYIISGLAIAGAIAGVLAKQITPAEGVEAVLAATGLSTVRAGSKADADKVINHIGDAVSIVAAIAPIVAGAMPGTAKAASAIGEIAGELESAAPVAPAA